MSVIPIIYKFSEAFARQRGYFIACVNGLKGFPEAIETVYPHAIV